jgi:hypothetical protein
MIGNAVQLGDVPNAVRWTNPRNTTGRKVREGVVPDDAKSEDRPDETGAGEGRRVPCFPAGEPITMDPALTRAASFGEADRAAVYRAIFPAAMCGASSPTARSTTPPCCAC